MSPDANFVQEGSTTLSTNATASAVAVRSPHYRLLDMLGGGPYGEVYRAQDLRTSRTVALKLLWGGSDPVRLLREAESHARLHHTNIAQIYEAGEWPDGRFYVALQLIDGSDLQARLGDERLRDPQAAVQLISKVARAMHFAHEHLVLHCDLKPSNILIDQRGTPFVSDFGIACLLDRERSEPAAVTLAYMAPEQCDDGVLEPAIDRWTDVYALGVILYQLVTGRLPYALDASLEERRVRFSRGELPEPPSALVRRNRFALGRKLDGDFDRICAAALAINPFERYPSAEALADDLDRWSLRLPICGPARVEPTARAYIPSFVRRNLGALSLWVLPLILFLAASVYCAYVAVQHVEQWFRSANGSAAQLQGQLLAARFEGYRREVADLAQDPAVKRILLGAPGDSMADALAIAGQRMSAINWRGGPDQFYFLDTRGCYVSQWPSSAMSADVYESWYGFRSYFTCAEELQRKHSKGACFARVFRPEHDWVPNTLRSAMAAPVYDDEDQWIGVLAASWPVERSLTDLALVMPGALRGTTSMLVSRDRERSQLKTANAQLPTCTRSRAAAQDPGVLQNPRVGPAAPDSFVVLPRSTPRDERSLTRVATASIAERLATSDLHDPSFLDPRDGKRYAVSYAALNPHSGEGTPAEHAPLLAVSMDRERMADYTHAIYAFVLVLWAACGTLLYGLLKMLARRDAEQLRWLKRSSS